MRTCIQELDITGTASSIPKLTSSVLRGVRVLAVDVDAARLLLRPLGELFQQRGHHVLCRIVGKLLPAVAIKDAKHIQARPHTCAALTPKSDVSFALIVRHPGTHQ